MLKITTEKIKNVSTKILSVHDYLLKSKNTHVMIQNIPTQKVFTEKINNI